MCSKAKCQALRNKTGRRDTDPTPPPPVTISVCEADGQECPDGTHVSRDPAEGCTFPTCPITVTWQMHSDSVCPGQNELGSFVQRSLAECKSACAAHTACVSFEYGDHRKTCHMSTSCGAESMKAYVGVDLYIKA